MEQQKNWAVPLILAVGASCYTALQTISARQRADSDASGPSTPVGAPGSPRTPRTGRRRSVMANPYNRNSPRGHHTPRLVNGDGAAGTTAVVSPRVRREGTPIASQRPTASTPIHQEASPAEVVKPPTEPAPDTASGAGSSPACDVVDFSKHITVKGNGAVLAAPLGASCKPGSSAYASALVRYFNPSDDNATSFYSCAPADPNAMTPLGIRGVYHVRLGPLRLAVRPGFTLESDDYRFPLQCYRFRHKDGSLLTLLAEECSLMDAPMTTNDYTARSVKAAAAAAEQSKTYFKVKLNRPARDVVTTVMETYVNTHIGPVPVVVASFFLVRGSLALTVQLQANQAQYGDRMSDLFATVQNAQLDEITARQFTMVSRGGQCTHALRGPTFSFLLMMPTTVSIHTVACEEESLRRNTDEAGNITIARLVHRPAPHWTARLVIRPQSKWRLVRWLRQAHADAARRRCVPLTADPYEFPMVPEMASLVVDADSVTDLAGVTAMVEALRASGALFMEVPPTVPGVSSQKAIGWAPSSATESGDNSSVASASAAAAEDWLTPSAYFPRYESVHWSLPVPSTQDFDCCICEHAGDSAVTLFLRPVHGTPGEMFELEPMLLHCSCQGRGAASGCEDVCIDRFIKRSAALFTHASEPHTLYNSRGEACVIVQGVSNARRDVALRLAAVHVCGHGDSSGSGTSVNVDYWIVFRWTFDVALESLQELQAYENQLLQTGRPC